MPTIQGNTTLQAYLARGLAVVTEAWNYKAKNWVTSVCAADIDNDGDIEIIAASRDGRVRALTRRGDIRWERIIGYKEWVGTVASVPQIERKSVEGKDMPIRIVIGTRDGLVYALDRDGRTLAKTGERYGFGAKDGRTLEKELEPGAFWFQSEHVIRQVLVNPHCPSEILISSEDRHVYLLDTESGTVRWQFATNGWVRAIFMCDIDGDGEVETLVGSKDKHIYILNSRGECIAKRRMEHSIYTLFAADIDDNGQIEILVGTDDKELLALHANLETKWRQSFENRILALQAINLGRGCKIIAGSEDKHIYFLDEQGRTIWRHNLEHRVFSVYACDIDNDGQIEVLAGSEDRVHVLRVSLVKDLVKKIRQGYQKLGKPAPASMTTISSAERALLQDTLQEEVKEHLTLKQVTLKHAEVLIDNHEYLSALSDLLRLRQQKVQVLWRKDDCRHIRSLGFGDIAGNSRREVIVGTSEGNLYAFSPSGRTLWKLPLGEEILSVQTGYLERGRWEDTIVCSSDHHIYVVGGVSGTKGQQKLEPIVKRSHHIDDWMTSQYVSAVNRQGSAEVIIGSADKKISIYDRHLKDPLITIPTPQGIKTIYAHPPKEGDIPEIVAGSMKDTVYAYTRSGAQLWHYTTRDRVRAVCVKDIDGDDQLEIVIGSEDRNVHVLDSKGQLKWRYYLPHSVMSIDAIDADHDGKIEIFLGCADGWLYVLNRDGDFLWKYRTTDRIRVVQVEDIDDDENIEIALGAEDQLEVLQVVDQQQVKQLIDQCWYALQKGQTDQRVIEMLLEQPDANLRAFALQKLANLHHLNPHIFDTFETFAKDNAVEVRQALINAVMVSYPINPQHARRLLTQFAADSNGDIRRVFVEQIQFLIAHDWEAGFEYLEGLSQNSERFVRRAVLRQLHHLIDRASAPYDEKIFQMLLKAAKDRESEWIRQEAARTLAHFLDRHHGDLIINLFRCISQKIVPTILRHIGVNAKTPVVQHLFTAFAPLVANQHLINESEPQVDELDDRNALERIERVANVLEEVKSFKYGEDTWLMYEELRRLFRIRTLSEIADYHCQPTFDELTPDNPHAPIVLRICQRLGIVTRLLRIYLKREGLNDRLSSLLEATSTIETINKFIEREYATDFYGGPMSQLPDRHAFELLLQRWQEIVYTQLSELRGRAELQADLKTRYVPHEEQLGIWVAICNTGRSSANNVKISLLHNGEFDIVGRNSFETEVIFAQEEAHAEFVIRPHSLTSNLCLNFEIIYDDTEAVMKTLLKGEQLEFQSTRQEFNYIPNHYSTGTPTHDNEMFYGREKDIEFLKDNLTRAEAKTVIVLYGQRRSGKTTLLLHLVNTTVLDPHIPIIIDMQKESYQISAGRFFHHLAFYIFRELRKRGIIVNKPLLPEFEQNPTFAFDIFLEDAEEQLTDRKIIVLIDEFEVLEAQVKKGKLEPELFEYLRSLMQHHRSINFLLSGTHTIEELTRGYWSVFFNIARHYRLSRLSPESAIGLITGPVKGYLEYEPYAVRKIRDLTADQPYLIHLICRSLVDHCNEKRKAYATINDVNTVLQEVMQTGQFHFDWQWEQISAEERVVLAALAEGGKEEGRPLSLIEIEEIYRHYRIPYKKDQVTTALRELIEADAIERIADDLREHTADGARFKIPVGLIRQWIIEEKPLDQTLLEEQVPVNRQSI